MAKKRETGQTAPGRRWLSAVIAAAFGLGVALLSGCTPTPVVNAPQPADPLNGVLTPPGMPLPASAPKASASNVPPSNPQFGVADSSSTNNATLAGMTWQGPLGKPLAIDDTGKTQTPGQLTTGSKSQPPPTVTPLPNPNPKVEAIPDAKPATPTGAWQPAQPNPPLAQAAQGAQQDSSAIKPVVQTVAASAAPSISTDALTQQLKDRGVVNQKVDPVDGGVKLTCCVARVGGAGFRILDATAVDYNSAAQAILKQLDTVPQQP